MNNKKLLSSNRFVQPVTVTIPLIEDLKAGRETFLHGQWLYSKKYKTKVKYVGTFHIPEDGVIRPTVVFSYPKKGEDAIGWNRRFSEERRAYMEKEKFSKNRYPNVKPLRTDYRQRPVTQPQQQRQVEQSIETTKQKGVVKWLVSLFSSR